MDLVHHLLLAEQLRRALGWPESVRGQMLLGALVSDAHTAAPALDRTCLHPPPEEDVVAYVTAKLTPPGALEESPGRAFAVSAIGHLVADARTRPRPYQLPETAPTGLVPVQQTASAPGGRSVEVAALRHALRSVAPLYTLEPVTPEMLGVKREEVLLRPALRDGVGLYAPVDALAQVLDEVVADTLARLRSSEAGAALLRGTTCT